MDKEEKGEILLFLCILFSSASVFHLLLFAVSVHYGYY